MVTKLALQSHCYSAILLNWKVGKKEQAYDALHWIKESWVEKARKLGGEKKGGLRAGRKGLGDPKRKRNTNF